MNASKATYNVSRRPNPDREVVQLRAEAEWLDLLDDVAEQMGLSMSAYLRLAVNEKIQRDGMKPRQADRSRRKREE